MEWQIKKAIGVNVHENNVREHFYCVREIFSLYNTKEKLERLAQSEDLRKSMGAAALGRVRSIGGWTQYGDRMEALARTRSPGRTPT